MSSWLDRLNTAGRTLGHGLLQLVYPGYCLLCAGRLDPERGHFCPACEAGLFVDPLRSCPRCAATVGPFTVSSAGCSVCRTELFSFDAAVRLGPYEGVRQEAVLRMKHHTGEGLAEVLGDRWAERVASRLEGLRVEAVVPVPLHWWRRWRRGYNQSAALAWGLANRLGLAFHPWALRRIRFTPSQTQQTREGRRENVRSAFRARRGTVFAGRNVLIVDDVMTTGATASEAALALKNAGAGRVVVAALTRA
jgi:ComF family protein